MKIDNRDIYEKLGILFYAIATDQHIKPLEVGELKLLISKEWSPRGPDKTEHIVSVEVHCILLAMDTLQANNTSSIEAYEEFSKFYALHPEVFSSDLKQRILNTATSISKIFIEDNKGVNQHLSELKTLIQLPEISKV